MDIQQIKDIKLNFILATARTGSTLLVSMLNMHPNVLSTLEEPFAYNLYPKYKNIKIWTTEIIREFCNDFYLFSEGKFVIQFGTRGDLESILEDHKPDLDFETAIRLAYLCFFPDKAKGQITTIVDKQLTFHFVLKKVARYYPQSKFIILHRDPRDNALAKYRMFQKTHNYIDYFRISCIWNYVYSRLLFLKNKIGSERFLEIKYKDLVSNPETELKKVCDFIDISYTPSMLNYDEEVKTSINKSKEKLTETGKELFEMLHKGLTEKVNTKKVGFYKQGLKKNERDLIWTICGKLALKIGYKQDDDFVPQKLKLRNYLTYIDITRVRLITYLYHETPFFVRRFIKRLNIKNNTINKFRFRNYLTRADNK